MHASRLAGDKVAIIELVAITPVETFPERHVRIIAELAATGLIIWREDRWYPTAKGLSIVGYTLH